MKKVVLTLLVLLVTATAFASEALQTSLFVYDYKTRGPVTASTKQIGAIISVSNWNWYDRKGGITIEEVKATDFTGADVSITPAGNLPKFPFDKRFTSDAVGGTDRIVVGPFNVSTTDGKGIPGGLVVAFNGSVFNDSFSDPRDGNRPSFVASQEIPFNFSCTNCGIK